MCASESSPFNKPAGPERLWVERSYRAVLARSIRSWGWKMPSRRPVVCTYKMYYVNPGPWKTVEKVCPGAHCMTNEVVVRPCLTEPAQSRDAVASGWRLELDLGQGALVDDASVPGKRRTPYSVPTDEPDTQHLSRLRLDRDSLTCLTPAVQ